MKLRKVLGICGSLRRQSSNMGLLRFAKAHVPEGLEIDIADLSAIPFFNSDIPEKPKALQSLLAQMDAADGFLFACPEYNYSIAPALKNALDWASREPENRLLFGKPAAIMGAGGGMGTSRAQYHLRQVGVFLNLHFLNKPEVFCNAFAGTFDSEGNLIDQKTQGMISQQLLSLQAWINKIRE